MTNREVLEAIAEELCKDFLVLTYEEILDEYVGDVGIDTVEDFCGYDMEEDEIAYWVMDQDPLFRFSKADEDISDEDANDFLMYWDIDDDFPELREQYEEAARTGKDHREIAVIKLVSEMEDDFSELEDYLSTHDEGYPGGDLYEYAFREAVRQGNAAYVEEHAEDFDLNDEGGYSSYIEEAANEEIVDILMECGAFKSEDEYMEYRFAMETTNGTILNFDSDFQEEVFQAYLDANDLTEEEVIEYMSGEDDAPDSLENDLAALGVVVEDDEIQYRDMSGELADETKDLLEQLGWELDFEGDAWKLETRGVYFIE